MIPLYDDVPCGTKPYINFVLISLSSLMFALQLWANSGNEHVVERLGMVPARFATEEGEQILIPAKVLVQTPFGIRQLETVRALEPAIVPEWATLLTCVFLHGGWLHFLGNMWFLWIFGDNVEDRIGHVAYLVLYLGTGVVASMSHLIVNFDSVMPTIGASGAIAGVMGAYFWLYPRAKVLTMIPLVIFWPVVVLPAQLFLAIWFLMQFWSGTFAVTQGDVSGVAWWAHIGGFMAGLSCGAALGHTNSVPESTDDSPSHFNESI
ncbi:MAG: rhomboid family intramembrane serine protease [Planctomycetales bacterium]|nr:rhomboid family intramembrane serine protease [Planctomycetales bacterium]